MWYVYIVKCSDGSLYTGITLNIAKRISIHNNKKGARSLFGKLPVQLVYSERFTDKISAAKREYEIKSWSRMKKLKLISTKVI